VQATSPPIYDGTDLLRFSTAGSVDDGKSTLIGRLLYESKAIFQDQLAEVSPRGVHVFADAAARDQHCQVQVADASDGSEGARVARKPTDEH